MTDSVPQFSNRAEIYSEFITRFHKLGEEEKARAVASENLRLVEEIKGYENKIAALAPLSEIYRDLGFEVDAADTEVLDVLSRQANS